MIYRYLGILLYFIMLLATLSTSQLGRERQGIDVLNIKWLDGADLTQGLSVYLLLIRREETAFPCRQ